MPWLTLTALQMVDCSQYFLTLSLWPLRVLGISTKRKWFFKFKALDILDILYDNPFNIDYRPKATPELDSGTSIVNDAFLPGGGTAHPDVFKGFCTYIQRNFYSFHKSFKNLVVSICCGIWCILNFKILLNPT